MTYLLIMFIAVGWPAPAITTAEFYSAEACARAQEQFVQLADQQGANYFAYCTAKGEK